MEDGGSGSSIWSRLSKVFTKNDADESLERAIYEASKDGEVDQEEKSMLLGVLSFDDLEVQDIMTPRTDMRCLPSGTSIVDVAKFIVESGHSRIPIFKETRDNIIGIIHAKDLLRCLIDPIHDNAIDSLMSKPYFVLESKIVGDLLQEFRTRKQHIALVIDEYGGTSGIVTIEDVIEEIFGDIEDEYDNPKKEYIRIISENVFECKGRTSLDDLREFGINIESDEVDTIGGYISFGVGYVPKVGEEFVHEGWKFTIMKADAKLIHLIAIEPSDKTTTGNNVE